MESRLKACISAQRFIGLYNTHLKALMYDTVLGLHVRTGTLQVE